MVELRILLCVTVISAFLAQFTMSVLTIKLVAVATNAQNPIGVEWHEPTNTVLFSLHYSSGFPFNFARLTQGVSFQQFSSVAGLTDEVYMASPRSGVNAAAGFTVGEVFTGNGVDGQILRIASDGSSFGLFTTLQDPGNPMAPVGLLRGGLQFDQTGVWGGNLLVSTTTGYVFVVHADGTYEFIHHANLPPGYQAEGITAVPNNPTKFGPFAGNILVGFDMNPGVLACKPDHNCTIFPVVTNANPLDNASPPSWAFEGFHLADGGNFYGNDYVNNRVLSAAASNFTAQGLNGELIISHEGGLLARFVVSPLGQPQFERIFYDPSGEMPLQWEGITFAFAGVGPIEPVPPPLALNCTPILVSPNCTSITVHSDTNTVGIAFGEGGISCESSCVPVEGELSTLFFTQFGGVTNNVNKLSVDVDYNPTPSVTFGAPANVAQVGGNADGIVRNTNFVYVGNGAAINQVNTMTSAVNSFPSCPLVPAYHLKITTVNGVLYLVATSILVTVFSACFLPILPNGDLGAPITVPVYLGANNIVPAHVTTIIDSPHGYYYTTDLSVALGAIGSFGQMTIAPALGSIHLFPASILAGCFHSGQWDPFSSTLLTWGNSRICQTTVNPMTGAILPANIDVHNTAPLLSSTPVFDQGTVDGLGNLFLADNTGHLWYSLYRDTPGAKVKLGVQGFGLNVPQIDDLAPLIGAGSSC